MRKYIKSKRNLVSLIFMLMFPGLLFGGGGFIMLGAIIKGHLVGRPEEAKVYFLVILLLGLFIAMWYATLVKWPAITIDTAGIRFRLFFRTRSYSWNEISKIQLTGKRKYKFLHIVVPAEAVTIRLHDGREIPIWESNYRNMPALRLVLQRAAALLKLPDNSMKNLDFSKVEKEAGVSDMEVGTGKLYKGNYLLSGAMIAIYAFIVLIFILDRMLFSEFKKQIWVSLLNWTILVVVCWPMTIQLYYFEITNHYLVVRHHLFWWHKKNYAIGDIMELVVEAPGKRSNSLRIITNDFKTRIYTADSIRAKDWPEFIEDLRARGLTVRDELFGGLGH
ncbi:PH domain-containing protein [Paraflavitalea sp. CAU 1676]|uniref:PH domain-containing protein n=1 Tax=Paraflavitalea sp. CAU 1676 TaxID=3032598 RepID=UPI0023DA89CF|nr:PH domain-containing protein [Paraflavitalea sp. CAU 1676]MDF2187835.1 PH domain-containing protein [Paraflavitalea sp. CAU 1676]